VRPFVDWSLVERDLGRDPALGAIAEDVYRFVDHYDAHAVEQATGAPGTFRLPVVGGRVVTLYYDAITREFAVLLVQPPPDPDAQPDDDPGEYEPEE
jgi:hypothetical protein